MNQRPRERLSPAGIKDACDYVRAFLTWAREHPRTMRGVNSRWIGTLRPPRLAGEARKERRLVTIEHIRQLIACPFPESDLVITRDRAAACFLFLTGVRAAAFCSLYLACVDMQAKTVRQYPELGVRTKNQKAILTRMFDIPDLLAVVQAWDAYLRARFPASAPWYPATYRSATMAEARIVPEFADTRKSSLNKNLKQLFRQAGLPDNLSPHKFRHGNAVYGLKQARTMEDFKAVSMNPGHNSIGNTDSIYAILTDDDLQERIAKLSRNSIANAATGSPAAIDTAQVAAIVEETIRRLTPARS